MRNLENELKNKTINHGELLKYGFIKKDEKYTYKTKICDKQFEIIVKVENNKMTSKLIDIANEEEYILADIEESTGEFVGRVREEYEKKINDIIKKCTNLDIFKSNQAKEIIKYVKDKYNDDLEFLWQKFDNNAIWRNKTNNKWYAALLIISKRKLGIDSDEIIEIIDLRYQKEKIEEIIDDVKIFHGYHMNKNSWITIKLDNSVDTKDICDLIDNSYNLAIGNKCGIEVIDNKVDLSKYQWKY